ncbi:anaerobic ribonucleoside-triphosphate reductase activating protein [Corynebacterium sp. P5875]|uniref:Anaerobic ribonucleoside-triphosphate reductase activating protein n=1 Tax=Corynebacterium antarcticum TaxID=2800405 RepID=A0A9Q4CAR7_9CORY|nr:anaerobic ribonucleoside-triphosphate reductase activating protein [Corynebacterium antarcticum]MCX7537480.1 anaerobic ribonucleoside-triphosphate reductase activating protein [Corynebacterium antarcticum]
MTKEPEDEGPGLPVAGIIPFSATDWPGRLTATVFTQGCPWRCVYCHNPSLQDVGTGSHEFGEALELMECRRGLLDGLVISGGEPTMHRALPGAIREAHRRGFPVGLHTCGYAPARLAALLDDELTRPEWIGLDVKALPADLPSVVGCTSAVAERSATALGLVAETALRTGMEVQVRTTVWRGGIVDRNLGELRELVAAHGFDLVVQQARNVDPEGVYRLPA